jgi:hypothetical protein
MFDDAISAEPARVAVRFIVGTTVAVPVVAAFATMSAAVLVGRSLANTVGRALHPAGVGDAPDRRAGVVRDEAGRRVVG